MYNLIILILLTIFLYFWLKKVLDKNFLKAKDNYEHIKSEYDKVLKQNQILKNDNSILENNLNKIIALYEITQEICKSLDENRVFSNFREVINRYVEVGDCKLVKTQEDLKRYENHITLPLEIDKDSIHYLVAERLNEQDKEKFHILSQQFLLGIKRALLYKKVQALAITDSLTGVFSRGYFWERFDEEIGRSKKFKYNFSFLMVDIDHFKDYNDHYGHLVGDAILREISKTIRENMRQIDLVGRYGGEEFSIVLTETDREGARFAAERIREAIENKNIRIYDEQLKVTISIGIATFPDDAIVLEELVERADHALYRAKQTGRNKVCVYSLSP